MLKSNLRGRTSAWAVRGDDRVETQMSEALHNPSFRCHPDSAPSKLTSERINESLR